MASPFGSAPSLIIGAGVGAAAAAALDPAIEVPRQEAWKANPARVLDVGTVARLIAQGGIPLDATAYDYAHRQGFGSDKLDALVYMTQTVPGSAELLFLWRLGYIDETEWRRGLTKGGMRQDWIDRLAKTFGVPITAEEAAVAIHRSAIPNQGQLPDLPPVGPGKVLRYPEVPIDGYESAKAYGVGKDQMDALTRVLGLPPGMDLVARMVFRQILDRDDFDLAAAQSNRRREWAAFEFEGYRQIPTAEQFVEHHLRGWSTEQEMYAGTALHGMSKADTDVEFELHRRPLTVRQVLIGQRRGGKFQPRAGELTDPYEASVHQGSLGPEWYDLAIAGKESYPSYFVIRPLVQSGAITLERASELFLGMGWPEDVAKAAPAAFLGAKTSAADPHVVKAQTQLWTATHRSYVADRSDDATATTALEAAGVAADAVPEVLRIWQAERALVRAGLSASNVRKAYQKVDTNPVTGAAWTLDEALAALHDLGWSPTEAQQYLDIG